MNEKLSFWDCLLQLIDVADDDLLGLTDSFSLCHGAPLLFAAAVWLREDITIRGPKNETRCRSSRSDYGILALRTHAVVEAFQVRLPECAR
jgi:hypothetical protein